MTDEMVMDLVEVLLRRRSEEQALLKEGDLETAYDAGGQASLTAPGLKRAYSVLGGLARESGGLVTYRVLGKYTAFLLAVAATKADVSLTLVNADNGISICHCRITRGRDQQSRVAYVLVLDAAAGTTPFGVRLTDALIQAALSPGGLATLDELSS